MRVACLFSGGKDSTLAAFYALSSGWDVMLLTIESEKDSLMFHHPNTEFCGMQAAAMELEHAVVKTTNENELRDLKRKLKELNVDGVVSGALASEYQKQRIDAIADELGIKSFTPLWQKGENVLRDVLEYFETYIVSVSAEGLDENWLGRRLEAKCIEELKGKKHAVNIFFEGGEAETFVADAPFFKKRIRILEWEKEWDGVRGVAKIKKIELEDK